MKINKNNYEHYFLDYLDGNLSDREIQMLEDFLLFNPDLRGELEGTEKIILSPESIVFDQKEFLKKPDLSLPVNENNFEDFCIARAEGDLNDKQHTGLIKYSKEHPGTEKLFILFARLHLTPDLSIVFPGKEKLKRTIILISREILYPLLSIAAAVTFMLILYFRNEDNNKNMNGFTADLPAAIIAKPVIVPQDKDKEDLRVQKNKPVIQTASVITFSATTEKRKTPVIKSGESQKNNNNENKTKDLLPPQRLNPSFQIKLPSLADNQIYTPSIERGKITYTAVKASKDSPEYVSLSEYARKQLAEKILGNKAQVTDHISVWQIADAGISGINKITGSKMKLNKRINENGNVTFYSFDSKLLSFSKTAVR
jgi:hypothetical protein